MICDLCNSAIVGKPACLLGTKDVVTTKGCWAVYLKGLIADKVLNLHNIQESLPGFVVQLASSDTPWALCDHCKQSLKSSGLAVHLNASDLPSHGHALCNQSKLMEYEVINEDEMQKAFKAANSAAQEIMAAN